jgi:hypothetical protein
VARRIGKMKRAIVVVLGMVAIGCGSDTPFAPTPPPVAECERNRTAEFGIANGSTRSTYDIIIDGAYAGAIGPGQTITRTMAAGQHSVEFRFSNSTQLACSVANPNLVQCSRDGLTCRTDF